MNWGGGPTKPLSVLVLFLAAGCAATPAAPAPEPRSFMEQEHEEERRNAVGLFGGITDKDGDAQGSIGAKYERTLDETYGLGLIVELTPQLRERLVTLPALFIHPWRELSVTLAPGFESEDSETSFVFRTGVGWDFELGGGFTLAPELNYDFVDGGDNAVVLGVTLGYAF